MNENSKIMNRSYLILAIATIFYVVMPSPGRAEDELVAEAVVESVSYFVISGGRQIGSESANKVAAEYERLHVLLRDNPGGKEILKSLNEIEAKFKSFVLVRAKINKKYNNELDEPIKNVVSIVEECDLRELTGGIPPRAKVGDQKGINSSRQSFGGIKSIQVLSMVDYE